MATRKSSYQEGCLERVKRAKGPDVWVYRWRELQPDGTRLQKKQVAGTVSDYPTKSAAKKAVENLRAEVNAREERAGRMTLDDLWGHFLLHELHSVRANRSPTTIDMYTDNYRLYIGPAMGSTFLDEIKPIKVEAWLDSLTKSDRPKGRVRRPGYQEKSLVRRLSDREPLAPATKAKLRNQLHTVFEHAIRHELWAAANPIA